MKHVALRIILAFLILAPGAGCGAAMTKFQAKVFVEHSDDAGYAVTLCPEQTTYGSVQHCQMVKNRLSLEDAAALRKSLAQTVGAP